MGFVFSLIGGRAVREIGVVMASLAEAGGYGV